MRPFHLPLLQHAILTEGTREHVIECLAWNDHNGIFTDADSEAEDLPPLTLESARQAMSEILAREEWALCPT